MSLTLVLSFACSAFVLAAAALWKAYVPPQQRTVNALRERVEELEADVESLHERLTKRGKQENMAKARTAHEERAARRDRIEQEAMSLIEAHRANTPEKGAQLQLVEGGSDPAAEKAALRARVLLGR